MNYHRPLTITEQGTELLNRQNGSLNIVTISRIKGEIRGEILQQALNVLQTIHPLLNSRIVGELYHLQFTTEGTEKIPLRVLSQGGDESWEDVVREELNQTIDSSKTLLRCRLIHNQALINTSYLITTVHHGISDGLSCISLQSELLQYYQRIASGKQLDVDYQPALPSLEELLPEWMQGKQGQLQTLWFGLKLKLQMLFHQPEALESEKTVSIEERRCGMTQRYLEPKITQKLVKLCREEETTVQGAICAAMLLTVAKKISKGKTRNMNVSCRSYVDLRSRLEPPIAHNNMGILASFLTSFHKIKSHMTFWDLSREVTQNIADSLKRKDILKPLMLSRKILESYGDNIDASPPTISVTNIGRVNIPAVSGKIALEEISFVPSNVIFGKTFTVAVATFNDKMIFNFLVSMPSVSQDTMSMLAGGVINCLVEESSR